MKDREPFKLTYILLLYNGILTALNIYIFTEVSPEYNWLNLYLILSFSIYNTSE